MAGVLTTTCNLLICWWLAYYSSQLGLAVIGGGLHFFPGIPRSQRDFCALIFSITGLSLLDFSGLIF